MLQGRYKPITFNQVLATAKLDLGLENTTQNDVFLALKIEEGAKHLYNNDQKVLKFCDVDIIEGAACLPNGFETLVGVTLLDAEGCDCDVANVNESAWVNLGFVRTAPFFLPAVLYLGNPRRAFNL